MTLWNDFTVEKVTEIKNGIVAACTNAAGSLASAKQTALASLVGTVISGLAAANVRCLYDADDAAVGVVAAGRPYMADVVAVLRNSDNSFIVDYGRRTSTASTNKSGTEQVALAGNPGTTVEEKITIGAPDIRAASVGNVTAEDVDAGEKFRFDADGEKSLYILLGKWIKRASFPADL